MARLQTLAADNARLRGLLDAAERGNLDVQLAPMLDIDLDPTRQRLVLDAGSRDGVQVGPERDRRRRPARPDHRAPRRCTPPCCC